MPAELRCRPGRRAGCGPCWPVGYGEDQVAIRDAGVLARRLVRASRPEPRGGRGGRPGTVLVTGGTGALGGHVARWVAGQGAEHVVLASRRGPGRRGCRRLAAQVPCAGCRR